MVPWSSFKDGVLSRMPLIYVFLSGIGFSLQTLIIKLLKQRGFKGSFQCVFARGWCQLFLSVIFMYYSADRIAGKAPKLFGDTNYVRLIMFLRSFIGYGGIAFSFLSVELIPMGDATVLTMLSPLVASIAGYFILGEPWRLPEFIATTVSLTGAAFVARPSFLFGSSTDNADSDSHAESEVALGVIFALIAALSAGFAYVLVRMLGTVAKMPWANVCFAQALCQIVLAIPSLYIAGQVITFDLTMAEVGLIFLGGFVGAWSQIAMTVGMQREKSALATGMRMSDVVFGFMWQALFTVDEVSMLSLVGAILVSSSIVILVVCKQTPPPTPPAIESTVEDGVEGGQIELTHTVSPLQMENNSASSSTKSTVSLQTARRSISRLITGRLRGYRNNNNSNNNNTINSVEYSTLDQHEEEEEEGLEEIVLNYVHVIHEVKTSSNHDSRQKRGGDLEEGAAGGGGGGGEEITRQNQHKHRS